jgi:hypothetical protein
MIAENWDEIGAAAVFGLGCVFLDGAWVMIVCIGALSGHRASAEADLLVAERVTRHEYGVDARLSAIEEEQAATIRMLAEISRTVAQLARAYGLDADDLERRRSGRRNSGD